MKKIGLILAFGSLSLLSLSGCNLMDGFGDRNQGARPPVLSHEEMQEHKHSEPVQVNTAKRPSRRTDGPKAESPSFVKEQPVAETRTEVQPEDTPNVVSAAKKESYQKPVSSCSANADAVQDAVHSLARMAINSYQPKQPNITMVNGFSAGSGLCYHGTSLTQILKSELSSSGRYFILSSQLEKKMRAQQGQASNAYLIRLAKAQNVDYIVSGQAMVSNGKPVAVLRIMALSSGAIVWQRSVPINKTSQS